MTAPTDRCVPRRGENFVMRYEQPHPTPAAASPPVVIRRHVCHKPASFPLPGHQGCRGDGATISSSSNEQPRSASQGNGMVERHRRAKCPKSKPNPGPRSDSK